MAHTHRLHTRGGLFAVLALPFFLVACGSDATGPTLDSISASDIALYCIRGEGVAPTSLSGSIGTSDCNDGFNDGYYESWMVTVGSSGVVTFAVTSGFDSYLELLQIGNLSDIANTTSFLEEDDDNGIGANSLDARLSYSLQPNTNYAIIVSGYDDSEQGPYTLAITGP